TLAALDALMRLPETRAWQPSVGLAGDGEARRPAAYAPYALTHYAAWEPMATLSAAIQRVRAAEAAYDPYGPARARLHGRIAAAAVRLEARLGALRRSLATLEEIEALQVQGNAILVMSATIRPGQRELVVDPVALGLRAEGHAELRISLDPALTPAENAQAVFRRYRKLQAAHGQVPALVTQTELELDYMRQLAAEADLAEDRGQLDEVERALGDALQPAAGARPDAPRGAPLRVTTPQGDVILVGRNSAQNHEITFRRAAPDDVWLHAQGIPGAHVVLKPVGGVLTEGALRAAAQLAAYYSAARHEARVLVAYTRRRHVRPIKGGRPGMVTYSQEQTLSVAPAPASAPTR
ncbi:MAG: NFACT RNA binding domain-containing protein, partial [Chloroflexota bacterium]